MKSRREQDYYLGLDIGTESVGYAVTDENYNILKFNGKNMWGSRLFDEAQTAAERRTFRSGRRRLQRRAWRIQLLQELFSEEISKVDQSFFVKMKESPLILTDKTNGQKYTLFNDDDYSDIDYYSEFPTIYHLRKALLMEDRKFDVRLLYLAVHHIVKHRGHFLFQGSVNNATSFHSVFDNLKICLRDEFEIELVCHSEEKIAEILKDKKKSKRDKCNEIFNELNVDKSNKQIKSIVTLITGMKAKVADIFDDESLLEIDKPSISFSESSYETLRVELEDVLGERCGVIDIIKCVYDWAILADILDDGEINGKSYLSVAKVNLYDKHKEDLRILKQLFKENHKVYKEFFVDEGKSNYCAYVGFVNSNGNKKNIKRCNREDFIKNLKGQLGKIEKTVSNQSEYEFIEQEIQADTILPIQVSKDNGVIPYQVQEIELKDILAKAEKYMPFLSVKDADGLSVSDKIIKIFEFRVPYYVGPLNSYNNTNSWMVRKSDGKITPWNFDNKVDKDASAEKFIRKMTNKCTYLIGEDVLPKHALLYEEFNVLNELNNVKIGANKMNVELKKDIIENLFKKKKKVTGRNLREYLKSEGLINDDEEITGFDINFKSSMSSYLDLKKILGDKIDNYSVKIMVEQIILWITVYGDEISILKRVIRKQYDDNQISDEEIKKVSRLKYQGWGRLSRKFLGEIEGADKETGEIRTVIGALRDTQDNLMQLLGQKYTFSETIENINNKNMKEIATISYKDIVEDIAASPSIKRAVWQVILISEEIRKIMGKEPAKIFVEVARGAGEKKRTVSRKDRLISLYESCKDESKDWKKELEQRPEDDFHSIKLYLYYTQMGRCMYSGEPIDLSRLSDANVYDRDHIYPQSKTKDDSLDNLVLVKRELNAKKSNGMISSEIQKDRHGFWKGLLNKGFISQEKYYRLMRKDSLTDEELASFINRQLVEARQSSKIVIGLFNRMYPDSKVAYVKANLVSDFKNMDNVKITKVRSLNDYHHAKDAYLNIVVGNVYFEKFTNNPLQWLKKNRNAEYSLNQMFNYDLIKNDKVIWKRGNNGTLRDVLKNINKRDIQYTQQVTTIKRGQNGGLFNQQLVGKDENASMPVKKGRDVNIYGGYKSITPAFFTLIESEDKKGNKQRSIESVPLFMKNQFLNDSNSCMEYFENVYGLKNPKVVISQIRKNTYLIIDDFPVLLRGSTGKQLILQCAVQLMVSQEQERYLKKLEKYIQKNSQRKDKKQNLPVTEYDGLTQESNIRIYDTFIDKLTNTIYSKRPANPVDKLKNKREIFEQLSVECQCIVLNEILHLFQCKPIMGADLSMLGEAKATGIITKNKIISTCNNVIIVNQSVTGLFKQETDLLNI